MAQLQNIDDKEEYRFFLLIMSQIINFKRSGPRAGSGHFFHGAGQVSGL